MRPGEKGFIAFVFRSVMGSMMAWTQSSQETCSCGEKNTMIVCQLLTLSVLWFAKCAKAMCV